MTRFAIATAALLAILATVVTAGVTSAHAAGCRHIAGPFHTRGAAVLNAAGRRYIPYGINVVGLAHPLTAKRNLTGTVSSDQAVIQAAATLWCSNTVRLQVAEDSFVAPGGKINRTFLAAVRSEVDYARQLGLVVALNAQSQTGPNADQETMPTHRTIAFWRSLSHHYGKDPSVVFDLFNEPRKVGGWSFWRNGGWRNGIHFYGMQQVANSIRQHGGRNLLWVEGRRKGTTLAHAWAHRLRGVYPLMYAEHRPDGPHTTANWDRVFGYLAAKNLAPVLDGEWANYARGGGRVVGLLARRDDGGPPLAELPRGPTHGDDRHRHDAGPAHPVGEPGRSDAYRAELVVHVRAESGCRQPDPQLVQSPEHLTGPGQGCRGCWNKPRYPGRPDRSSSPEGMPAPVRAA